MKELHEVIKNPELVHQYQVDGSQCGIDNHYVICGDEMGLGKTLQGIIVSLRTGLPTIVICPSYLRYNWEKEYVKWSVEVPSILVVNTADVGDNLDIFRVIICSYSLIAQYPHLLDGRGVVLGDEVHYLKNMSTKRWKGVDKYLDTFRPEYFFGMSGTPITKGVLDWYGPLRLLDYCPDKELSEEDNFNPVAFNGASTTYYFPNYYTFANHFSNRKKFKVGGRTIVKYEGTKNLQNLRKVLKGKYFRRLAKDHLELPELIRKDIIIDMNVDEELEKAWEDGTISEHVMSAKSHSAFLKGEHTGRYVNQLLEDGEGPIIIFTDHISPLKEIKGKLKNWKGELIQGSTPVENRAKIVDSFQEGKLDYLIATISSMNTGWTLTAGRNIVFNDLSWNPADVAQAEKRIHRIGQKHNVVIHRVIKGRVDESIVSILTRKVEEIRECT